MTRGDDRGIVIAEPANRAERRTAVPPFGTGMLNDPRRGSMAGAGGRWRTLLVLSASSCLSTRAQSRFRLMRPAELRLLLMATPCDILRAERFGSGNAGWAPSEGAGGPPSEGGARPPSEGGCCAPSEGRGGSGGSRPGMLARVVRLWVRGAVLTLRCDVGVVEVCVGRM